jgi:hypothetical protein
MHVVFSHLRTCCDNLTFEFSWPWQFNLQVFFQSQESLYACTWPLLLGREVVEDNDKSKKDRRKVGALSVRVRSYYK